MPISKLWSAALMTSLLVSCAHATDDPSGETGGLGGAGSTEADGGTKSSTSTGTTSSSSGSTSTGSGSAVGPGDLVITEIMSNPELISDTNGEWFELFNTTASNIDLEGLVIRHEASDPTAVHTIAASVIAPAHGYVVLGKDTNMQENGGAPVAYAYPQEIGMTNEGDYLAIETADGTIVDNTAWSGVGGFSPEGASRTLDPDFIGEAFNNDETHFCAATTSMSGGDRGTPGAPNDPCP